MNDPKYYIEGGRLWSVGGNYPIPDDEPTFTFRGKYPVAPVAIRAYIAFLRTLEPHVIIEQHIQSATEQLNVIEQFQARNAHRVSIGCHSCK